MKRILTIIACLSLLIIPLLVFIFNDDVRVVNKRIEQTNNYIKEKNIDDRLFSNILQSKLDNSLIYNIDNNEDLIIYKNSYYIYKNTKLNEINYPNYKIENNVEDALNNEIGTMILTKGYYKEFDGGNGYFIVEEYLENDNELIISNKEKTKSLKYICFNSTINVYQMGYKNEYIDTYINHFTEKLKYENIYLPKRYYLVNDNFDIFISNKGYYAYNATFSCIENYSPSGTNNGCLFYVHNDIENINIFGFQVTVCVNEKLQDPLLGLLSARDVDNLIISYCSFYLPQEAQIYSSSGMIDFFTGWKNVKVLNCVLENHSSTVEGGGIGLRDIYKKGCYNAQIENNKIYSNCKDEVIAIFAGGDTSLYPNETGGGYIKDVVLKNNYIIGGKPNEKLGPRVVGLTVGYQLSPVYNISYIDNVIEMYSANYLFLYGKADTVNFINNKIKIDASYQDKLYTIFCHNSHADSGNNINVINNEFETINQSSLYTISNTGEEFSFKNNTISTDKIYRVFDSKSIYEDNIINATNIANTVYHNVKSTKNNYINCKYLNVVFEFYNLNINDDILIEDHIVTEEISANFMMFNGTDIYFNNHKVTFNNFIFETKKIDAKYYYLAYDTNAIKDQGIINFNNSHLSLYEGKDIANDLDNKVIVNYN